jgi:hypothetical protein
LFAKRYGALSKNNAHDNVAAHHHKKSFQIILARRPDRFCQDRLSCAYRVLVPQDASLLELNQQRHEQYNINPSSGCLCPSVLRQAEGGKDH